MIATSRRHPRRGHSLVAAIIFVAMSPAPTLRDGINMPSKLRNLVQAPKPEITFDSLRKKKTYTTLDRIEGSITITAPIDTNFDSIDIEFVGTSRTFVERMTSAAAASGRSEAYHQFLKLSQPGLEGLYPEDLVLKAGSPYKFPFVFAVPEQLLPRICQHKVRNENVRHAHTQLPPTLGDKDLGGRSAENLDDIAPEMASIRYGIFARVTELKMSKDEVYRSTVASKARRVRVIPAVEEQPPLDVHAEEGEYNLRKERTIRKGLFKAKTGTLVMETQQPSALRLTSYNNPDSKTTTMATVMLRFDPMDNDAQPPKLGNLASKFKVATYFACTARQELPMKSTTMYDLNAGVHSEQFTLSDRNMANVEWIKQTPGKTSVDLDRRESAASLEHGEIPEESKKYRGGVYYTARLVVPITLPANKAFVPSFHSCLVSRTYALKFDLGITSGGILPSIEVKVPVQVTSDGLLDEDMSRRDSVDSSASVDADVDVDDVSDFFGLRTQRTSVPRASGRSRIGSQAPVVDDAPPGYSGVPLPTATAPSFSFRRASSIPSIPAY